MPADGLNVDICAAILADKPPQLPLREELNSLGFEVVLSAAGTGARASKYESAKAVKKYRNLEATKDLKRRRFFPKSSKRIKETLAERRQREYELGLPHACSYESYDIKLRSGDDTSDDSGGSSISEKKRRWGMFQRRQRQTNKRDETSNSSVKVEHNEDFQQIAATAVFPDSLAPVDATVNEYGTPPQSSHRLSDVTLNNDVWKKAFGTMAATQDNGTPQYKKKTHLVFKATHMDIEGVPNTFSAFDDLDLDDELIPKDSATTCVFDGLETDHQESACSAADTPIRRADPDGAKVSRHSYVDSSTMASSPKQNLAETMPPANLPSDLDMRDEKKDDGTSFGDAFAIQLTQSGNVILSQPQRMPFDDVGDDDSQSLDICAVPETKPSLSVVVAEGEVAGAARLHSASTAAVGLDAPLRG